MLLRIFIFWGNDIQGIAQLACQESTLTMQVTWLLRSAIFHLHKDRLLGNGQAVKRTILA